MAWIESHQSLGAHPKTKKLARRLGCSVPAAVGHLQFLWWWALDYAPDGNLERFEDDDIADAVLWEGTGDALVSALVDAGFIDPARRIHDWDDYAGRLLDRRAANTARKRQSRARLTPVTRDTPETGGGVTGLPTEPTQPTQPTEPNHTEPTEGEPTARSVRHKPIDEAFIAELQAEHPTVNVMQVYERAQNRKTWGGYKDKRRALRDHVGYAIEEQRRNGHGTRNGSKHARPDEDDPILRWLQLDREREAAGGM